MRTRIRSLKAQSRWLVPGALTGALLGTLSGCPNQELAPLAPCTVSGVSLEVPQTGVDKVDLLFMIDNSGSMAEEQRKLAQVLPNLVAVLTTGQYDPNAQQDRPDFPPVQSLHIGVVSSDMGVNGANALPSCGNQSFDPVAPDPNFNNPANPLNAPTNRRDKPLGDDGLLNISTAVAAAGISARPPNTGGDVPVAEVVAPDNSCTNLALTPNQRFIDFIAGQSDAAMVAQQFSCIAKLGKNGCGLEQQLESVLKAVSPANPAPPAMPLVFTQNTRGHGDGANRNFLRPDSILAVVIVSDEEDCSIPDSANVLFQPGGSGVSPPLMADINIRCGLNQNLLHPVSRYIDGLRALKPTYPDRIIVAGIVGIPIINPQVKTYSGQAELQMILDRPDMNFMPELVPGSTNSYRARPACQSPSDGSSDPGRRTVELAQAFGPNGVVTSICEDAYDDALDVIIQKIAAQLTGACLPRKLTRENGRVECDVVEVLADLSPCDPARGRIETLPPREVLGTRRTVCRIDQVTVGPGNVLENKTGWYYDDFSPAVIDECQDDPQRIAFTANAEPGSGSQVRFECFQPVSSADEESTGLDAVNLACTDNNVCAQKDQRLLCVNNACQIGCNNNAQCPESWLCVIPEGGQGYCVNPTCPPSQTTQ